MVKPFKNLSSYVFSFKLPFRLFAFLGIFYLSASTAIFTYKAGSEIWSFLQWDYIAPSRLGKNIFSIIGLLTGLAIFAQIAPIVWDRLSYWGQAVDNQIIKLFTNKMYFLDEADILMKDIYKYINQANCNINSIYWKFIYDKKNINTSDEITHVIQQDLIQANKKYHTALNLLKSHTACDYINQERAHKTNENLNIVINQLTNCYSELINIQHLLKDDSS